MLATATELLTARGGDWEIIVADNASSDRTFERAQPFLDGERVQFLRNEVNRGKGYSIRRGMLAARYDLRLMCDADCESSLASLGALEEVAQSYDIVVGSRLSKGARVQRQQTLQRRFVGLGF